MVTAAATGREVVMVMLKAGDMRTEAVTDMLMEASHRYSSQCNCPPIYIYYTQHTCCQFEAPAAEQPVAE